MLSVGVLRCYIHDGKVLRRRRCDPLQMSGPIRCEGWEVGDITDENPARLWSVLATMTPVGIFHLLGGVATVCRHLSPLVRIVVSG